MKRTFQIGSGIFGEGRTKICVPIVEVSQYEIWKKAQEIAGLPVDIVEWRGDFYEDILRTDGSGSLGLCGSDRYGSVSERGENSRGDSENT